MTTLMKPPLDVLFALDGDLTFHSLEIDPKATIDEFRQAVIARYGGEERDAVYKTDGDKPLGPKSKVSAAVGADGTALHVGVKHDGHLVIAFNGDTVHRDLSPAISLRAALAWALKALKVEGPVSDYQLKQGEEILKPDTHLGQMIHDHEPLHLALVMKVKPQGCG